MKTELIKELIGEIDILTGYRKKLAEEIRGKPSETEYISAESMEAQRYIVEIDRYEKPQQYYHMQFLKNHCEIRKGRKEFEIHCLNFTPEVEELKKNHEIKIQEKNYGGNLHHIYKIETLEEAQEIYMECIRDLYSYYFKKRDNLLFY